MSENIPTDEVKELAERAREHSGNAQSDLEYRRWLRMAGDLEGLIGEYGNE